MLGDAYDQWQVKEYYNSDVVSNITSNYLTELVLAQQVFSFFDGWTYENTYVHALYADGYAPNMYIFKKNNYKNIY